MGVIFSCEACNLGTDGGHYILLPVSIDLELKLAVDI